MSKKDPIPCQKCAHDMSRSRVKAVGVTPDGACRWTVRCNKCKTIHDVILRFPNQQETKTETQTSTEST